MGHKLVGDYDGVEVNGNLWNQVPIIRGAFPGVPIVHQVRDGRKVVRSALSHRGPERTVEQACRTWAMRNERMLREVGIDYMFRLEDLTNTFSWFGRLSSVFGAAADPSMWIQNRTARQNATAHHACRPFNQWPDKDRATFWDICGETMGKLGYTR